jgi:hypothetical protein
MQRLHEWKAYNLILRDLRIIWQRYRYVNIYRIIKSHRNLDVNPSYAKDDYMPTMFLLALIVGFSKETQGFVKELFDETASPTLKAFLDKTSRPKELKDVVEKRCGDDLLELPLGCFQKDLELISRFSFRTFLHETSIAQDKASLLSFLKATSRS